MEGIGFKHPGAAQIGEGEESKEIVGQVVVREYEGLDPQVGYRQDPSPDSFQDPVIGCLEDRKWGVIFTTVLDLLEYVGRGVSE